MIKWSEILNKITLNKLAFVREDKQRMEEALTGVKDNFETITEDGRLEKWTWEVDIEKVKQDPKFQAKWQKYLDTKASQGTQANHHITNSKNTTKTVKGGSLGGGALGIGEFIEQIK